jgi:amino acid transporter
MRAEPPGYLVFAQSLSSIAPLSSTAALLTVAMEQALASTPIAVALGVALYGLWVAIGYGYSSVIASYGGTYDFARASAGEGVARAIGWTYWLGSVSGKDVDKVSRFGLRLEPSERVSVPRWSDAVASLEARVSSKMDVGESGVYAFEVPAVYVKEGLYTRWGYDLSKVNLLLHG